MTTEDRAADLAVCDVGLAGSGGRLGAVVGAVSAVGERRDALRVRNSRTSDFLGLRLGP